MTIARAIAILSVCLAVLVVREPPIAAQRGGATTLSGMEARVLRARLPSGAVVSMTGALEIEIRGANASVRHVSSGLVGTARVSDVDFALSREVSLHDGAIVLLPGAPIAVTRITGAQATIDVTGLSMAIRGLRVPLEALAISAATATDEPESFVRAREAPRRVLVSRVPLRLTPEGGTLEATIDSNAVVGLIETRARFARIARLDQRSLVMAWVPLGALIEPPSTPAGSGGGMGVGGRIGLAPCTDGQSQTARLDAELFTDVRGGGHLVTYGGDATVGPAVRPANLRPVLGLPGIARIERCDRPIAFALEAEHLDAATPPTP